MGKLENLGCCGSLFSMLLTILNVIFMILGILIFILAAVLKWGSSVLDIDGIKDIIKFGSFDAVATLLLIFGAVIFGLALFGILGVRCASKFFLVIYEGIIIVLFLAHLISLIVLLFSESSIEGEFRGALNTTVTKLNENKKPDGSVECIVMTGLSTAFACCGNKGNDLLPSVGQICCSNYNSTASVGCTDKAISYLKDNAVSFIIIPSGVILLVELIVIVTVPFIMGKIVKK